MHIAVTNTFTQQNVMPPVRQAFSIRHERLLKEAERYLNKTYYLLIASAKKLSPNSLAELRERLEDIRAGLEDSDLTRMDVVDLHSEAVNVYLDLSLRRSAD